MTCGLALTAQAQSPVPTVLSTAGDHFIAGGYSVSLTVGEMAAIETFTGGSNILTQGFHQPDLTGVGMASFQLAEGQVELFPNPAVDQLHLRLELDTPGELLTQIFDAQGRLLRQSTFDCASGSDLKTIDLNGAAPGCYLLQLRMLTANGQTSVATKIFTILH